MSYSFSNVKLSTIKKCVVIVVFLFQTNCVLHQTYRIASHAVQCVIAMQLALKELMDSSCVCAIVTTEGMVVLVQVGRCR